MRPRLLDLFCCEGGASAGYAAAGFEVVGVDVVDRGARYPFEFHQGDALAFLAEHGHEFDVIAGSPPCKSENPLRHLHDVKHPDLLTPTLAALRGFDKPWVVENVESTAKLPGSLILCGTEFGRKAKCRDGKTRWLKRHRRFASNVDLWGAGGCNCTGKLIGGVYGTGGGGYMTRGYKFHPEEAREAMGIDWMSREGISQSIPPAYTEFLGLQLIDYIGEAAA